MKLLYWDIDGTLLNTGRAGLYAIEEVFHDLKGADVPVPKIAAGGRTDNFICQQLLYKATGIMPTDDEVHAFCRGYEKKLLKWLKRKAEEGVVLPHVEENLAFFQQRQDYKQLLLTGNSAIGARMKMDVFGLSQYFDFPHSGFAFNYYYRDDLARNALAIAKKTWGDAIEMAYVIGDTPYDIQCGHRRPHYQRRYGPLFLRGTGPVRALEDTAFPSGTRSLPEHHRKLNTHRKGLLHEGFGYQARSLFCLRFEV